MEPYENNPLFVVEEIEACWLICCNSTLVSKICLCRHTLGLVDCVSGSATWIQHGTVVAGWWNMKQNEKTSSILPFSLCVSAFLKADYAVPLFFLGLIATAAGQFGTDYLVKKVRRHPCRVRLKKSVPVLYMLTLPSREMPST